MNREMQKALEADGEKLRQLTGEDHGPYFPPRIFHPMSIGETAANGVNHTPSGTDSGEENISEVLANATPSETREGFVAGSWIICDDCADDDEVCVVPSCCFDALVVKDTTGTLDHDPIPRARLIAAAPDLLAALKAIKRFGELGCVDASGRGYAGGKKPATKDVWQFPRHMLVEIDAAILKAESQS